MSRLHFLNVGQGDCSVIEHNSGNVTVIDVCNARTPDVVEELLAESEAKLEKGVLGNFNQKKYPVNPISYLGNHDIDSVFRFIATHPDMDHLDGFKVFCETFNPINFWDTDNNVEKEFEEGSPYSEEDWEFYKELRDGVSDFKTTRLTYHAGAKNKYFNIGKDGSSGGDGLTILSPTPELVSAANECGDHNDCSYVLLYRTGKHKVLFGGDSHDKTWEHILKNYEAKVKDVDVLIAPHHGRDSDRSYEFLDVLNPRISFFGIAKAKHLGYSKWSSRDLPVITNNQAGSIIVDFNGDEIDIYVTHEPFAKSYNPATVFSDEHQGYYYGPVPKRPKRASV